MNLLNHLNNNSQEPRALQKLSGYLSSLVKGRLWLQVFIGMFLGITLGILLGPSVGWVEPKTATLISNWLSLPGQLFLALIQMIVIPLVVASILLGIGASENFQQLKKMGLRVALYFLATTVLAICLGFLVAYLIQPGNLMDKQLVKSALGSSVESLPAQNSTSPEAVNFLEKPQEILNILPDNPFSSMVEGQMFQIVLFSILFGVALLMISKTKSKPLLDVFGSVLEVCMTIVRWAMWLAPFAVFGLLTQLTSKIGLSALLGMAVYVATVLLGLFLMFLCYLLILGLWAKESPFKFLKASKEVLLLAFSTSSSAAVMPMTIKTVEEKLSVRRSVSQFVIPLGATINMNGTALYQGVATVFLAQVFGVEIGLAGLLLVVVTAVGASIGSPATPGVGIVVLAMVLESVGVPASGIALILGVDRILDMSRTAVNVCGDMVASKLTDRWTT